MCTYIANSNTKLKVLAPIYNNPKLYKSKLIWWTTYLQRLKIPKVTWNQILTFFR